MSHSRPRRRKVAILTPTGSQKLREATSQLDCWNPCTKSCTLEKLSEYTGLSTHTLSKVHARQAGVDLRTLTRYFNAFNLTLDANDYCFFPLTDISPLENGPSKQVKFSLSAASQTKILPHSNPIVSWGMAPDVSEFCGRTEELATLKQWVLDQRCRVVALFGIGGVGKTWLATRLSEQLQQDFATVVWRSLRPISPTDALIPFSIFLDDLLEHLLPQPQSTVPETVVGKIRQLMDVLRSRPCLLVLDNIESILSDSRSSSAAEPHLDNEPLTDCGADAYEAYVEFLRQLGQGRHQSCIILTSRVQPRWLQFHAGASGKTQALNVPGLTPDDIQHLLKTRGHFQGTQADWQQLVRYYDGNPLILGFVGDMIQRFLGGSITAFLNQEVRFFARVNELLDQQLRILPTSLQTVMDVLATQDAPLPLSDLRSYLNYLPSARLIETITSLQSRALVSTDDSELLLKPLMKNYIKTQSRSTTPVPYSCSR